MDKIIRQYIVKSGIDTLPITEDKLFELCKKEGFKVRSYSRSREFITAAGEEKAMNDPAFLYDRKGFKFIFYDDTLSASDRVFYIAHELVHIVLKHPMNRPTYAINKENFTQEDEANSCAYELLAPICILKDMDVISIDEIANVTGLSYGRAEIVRSRLIAHKGSNGLIEKSIVHNFRAKMGYKEPDEPEPISVDLDKLNKKRHKWYEWAFTGFLFATAVSLLIVFISLLPRLKRPDHFDVTPEQYEWLHPSSSDSSS